MHTKSHISLLRASLNFEITVGGASYLSVVVCFLAGSIFDCVFSIALLGVGAAFLRLVIDGGGTDLTTHLLDFGGVGTFSKAFFDLL